MHMDMHIHIHMHTHASQAFNLILDGFALSDGPIEMVHANELLVMVPVAVPDARKPQVGRGLGGMVG